MVQILVTARIIDVHKISFLGYIGLSLPDVNFSFFLNISLNFSFCTSQETIYKRKFNFF